MSNVLTSRLKALVLTYSRLKHKKTNMKSTTLDGSEASMMALLSREASRLFSGKKTKTLSFPEFSVGRGIADLYIIDEDKSALRRRKSLGVPAITDKVQNQIIDLLWKADGIPYEELESYLVNNRLHRANHHLNSLFEQGVIYSRKSNVYVREIATSNVIKHSVAIEAKVRDWRKGIKQALRYKNFADKSYLALYDTHIKTARENIHVFEALNIGLIGVSDNGIQVYYEPRSNDKDPLKSFLASERVYSLIDDSQDSFVARNSLTANAATQTTYL